MEDRIMKKDYTIAVAGTGYVGLSIDQRVYKILADNPDLFSADDAEHKRSKAFLLLGVASYLDIDIAEAIRH